MTLRSRTRLALVVLVLMAPAAAAGLPTAPSVPTAPVSPPPAQAPEALDIDEHGLVVQGEPTAPSLVRVSGPDGAAALEYAVDASGRARLDVAGSNVIADATLVALVGAPTDDVFTLYLRDGGGDIHALTIDRAALAQNDALPLDQHVPAIEVARPPAWPGAPSAPFAVFVEDSAGTHVAAAKLNGDPWLQRGGKHTIGLQIPLAEADFSRVHLAATRAGQPQVVEADFRRVDETADAAIYEASFSPGLLGVQDGERIEVQVYYERRASPLVVERFPEEVVYAYRVDGAEPSVQITAPATADDFSFAVSWSGADALSGLAGVRVDWRETGASDWTPWVAKTAAKSATFSGEWGRAYEFRAVAVDVAGNPSAPATASTTIVPQPGAAAAAGESNDPPLADIVSPRAGAVLAGATEIRWTATDPDAPVTSKLEVSRDAGRTWRTLYSGADTRTVWDTTAEVDGGGYKLRLTVSDGTRTATDDIGAISVRNVVSASAPQAPDRPEAPSAPAVPTAAPEAVQPAQADAPEGGTSPSTDEEKGVPAPFVGAALVAAALLARRRRA